MSTSTQTHTNISTTELKNRVSALMSQAHEDLAALVACQSVADPAPIPRLGVRQGGAARDREVQQGRSAGGAP